MKKFFFSLITILIPFYSFAQVVTMTPSDAGDSDETTITFDATQGNAELVGASKVYMHHGVVTEGPTSTAWEYVKGNWGADDGIGEMTAVAGQTDKWEITFSPNIREYFGVPAGENIFRISAVFRNADGSIKGTMVAGDYGWGTVTSGGDFFINLNTDKYISINSPIGTEGFVKSTDSTLISATASNDVSVMKIWIDEGSGYFAVDSVNSGRTIEYKYNTTSTKTIDIKVTATIGTENIEATKTFKINVYQPTIQEDLPVGIRKGINYDNADGTKATLVLEAPGKEFVFVVGDFNNWTISDAYQMKQTTDGELFWLEISGLTAQQEYVFQYWTDDAKIGDPYAEKISDPWNDKNIEASVYPNLPAYNKTEYETATVLQTGQTPYSWNTSEDTWVRPELDNLVIYELLVRDFIGTHSYSTLIDTLSYLKNLGVDAIEIMPFSEFEGNESWGYNPSYYFAPDKYYGPKDSLKKFIETAHQNGFAIIMDMVLNHAFGQNAMAKLYWDGSAPAADNPWFNRELPANHYGWGSDFNHESNYTKTFIDSVNTYWLEEYHIDGYRFDYTKGFTNSTSPDSYDASRIAILKRMADKIWAKDANAYVILEHWGPTDEESELADYGMKMWRNRSYDFVPAITGSNTGSFDGMQSSNFVTYFNSHDERRIAEHALSEGLVSSDGLYDVKNPQVMFERKKMAAAFALLFPGTKMMWQFDELGYDIHIDFNGRTGNKPLPWGPDGLGYYEDENRQQIYKAYKGILELRKEIGPENLATATLNHKLSGDTRRLSYDMTGSDLIVIGNFGLEATTINPSFTQTGTWYNYFSGESIDVTNITENITLEAGEWHIFTTVKYSDGMPGVVEVYKNPVTIAPYPFKKDTEITITFDASKASPDGTSGLVGASKVYMHSGIVKDDPSSNELTNIVGSLTDDGVGEMTNVGGDIWEITLTPDQYYGITASESIFKLGMYFRDADNSNVGKGFRNSIIYASVESSEPFITVDPVAFSIDDEITITFNAAQGNMELINASAIYMHTGVVLSDIESPGGSDWSNVVPENWGDNNFGAMTKVAGSTYKWEFTLTPRNYYGLSDGDSVYWISTVFRNSDGGTKGTGAPGDYDFGIIQSNGDFFIKNGGNGGSTSVDEVIYTNSLNSVSIYPNPANGYITVKKEGISTVSIYTLTGQLVKESKFDGSVEPRINISELKGGLYIVKSTDNANTSYTGRFLKIE